MAGLDDIFAEADAELAAPVVARASAHPLDSLLQEADAEIGASAPTSDVGGIRNAAVKGLSNAVSFAGEFAPKIDFGGNEKQSVFAPRLFGLSEYLGFNQPEVSPSQSGVILQGLAREKGLFDETKPASELGQLAADVTEQGLSASVFGPAAALGSAVTSGTGAYGGRKIDRYFGGTGEKGALYGSIANPFAVAALKTGVTKLAPSLSYLPGVAKIPGGQALQKAATDYAVGKTLLGAVGKEADTVETALATARPSAFASTGEAAKSQQLLALEDVVAAQGNKVLSELPLERAAARAEDLQGGLRDMSLYERAKELESGLLQSADNVTENVKSKWNLLDREQQLIPDVVESSLNSELAKITLNGDRKLPEDAQGLLNMWQNLKQDVTSVGKIQDFRSQVLEEGRAFKNQLVKNPTNADRLNYKVTTALQKHLDDVLDANVEAGVITGANVDALKNARAATREQMQTFAPQLGVKSQATKAALNAIDLKDTKAAQEILSSPDLMAAQLKAGDLGGVDLRPQMQEILLSNLPKSQTKWPEYVAKHELQFGLAFNGDPEKVTATLADIASEANKNKLMRSAFGANSSTFSRGFLNSKIQANKGLGALEGIPGWGAVQALGSGGGAIYGAKEGYQAGDTLPEKVALGLLGAGAGYAGGKVLTGTVNRASEAFDASLVDALRNPSSGLARLREAKPGLLGRNVQEALSSAKKTAGARGIGSQFQATDLEKIGLNKMVAPEDVQAEDQTFNTQDQDMSPKKLAPEFEDALKNTASDLEIDPEHLKAVINFETGGTFDPAVENKQSGATGLIQFMGSTAKEITGAESKAAALDILRNLSASEQLTYVKKYLARFKGKLNSLSDVYMAVLYPKAVGKDPEYPLFKEGSKEGSIAFAQNKGLDVDGDGVITKEEATKKVKDYWEA